MSSTSNAHEDAIQKAISLGKQYDDELGDHDQNATESPFEDVGALAAAGWQFEEMLDPTLENSYSMPIEQVIETSPHYEPSAGWSEIVVTHNETEARYKLALARGFIFAEESVSPRGNPDAASRSRPNLEHWSDVAFIQYNRLYPGVEVEGVAQLCVVNIASKRIIDDIALEKGYYANPKGCTFDRRLKFAPEERWFYALLGIPGGRSVKHLLLEHGTELGRKPFVKEIHLWWNLDNHPMVWYKIESVD